VSGLDALLAGPAGDYILITAMMVVTYACRASGALIMARMTVTPAVERALRAIPGSVVIATVLPIAARAGLPAFAGLCASVIVMALTRSELAALLFGLAAIAGARAVGL
jgi:uncharacterized membrane protein